MGTLIRHFLPRSIRALSRSMIATAFPALLVRGACRPTRHHPGRRRAVLTAVPLTPIAATTEIEDADAEDAAHLTQALVAGVRLAVDDLTSGHATSVHSPPTEVPMSRKKKKPRSPRPRRPPATPAAPPIEKVLDDTTAHFTCSHGVVDDFLYQLDEEIDELKMDIDFNQVALEIWQGRTGRGEAIAAALADYLAERKRNLANLASLRERFAALLSDDAHEHIDPVEPWRQLIHQRLFPDPPAS